MTIYNYEICIFLYFSYYFDINNIDDFIYAAYSYNHRIDIIFDLLILNLNFKDMLFIFKVHYFS